MEIKLVWMRDLGTAEAQGLPLSFSVCHSFLNRELTSCVREEKDGSSTHCQNVIWALSQHFQYQGHVWRLLRCVDLQNTLLFVFIVFFILLFSICFELFRFFLFSILISVSVFICLTCEHTYSSIFQLSVFPLLFLSLSYLERSTGYYKKKKKTCLPPWCPWKQIAFCREAQHKQQNPFTVAAWPQALNFDPTPMKQD